MRTGPHPLFFVLAVACCLGACGGRTPFVPLWDGGQNSNANNANTNTNTNANTTCGSAEDCTIARRADTCCACPEPASRAQIEADPCLIPLQSYVPPECWVDCSGVRCEACPPTPGGVECAGGQCAWSEPGACAADTDCVVGVRVDACCTQAEPVSRAARDADPCLVPWPPPHDIPQVCRERWTMDCWMLNCTWSGPTSRSVVCGESGCEPATECATEADCVIAIDANQCCACPDGYPAAMIGREPCVVPYGDAIPDTCPMLQCQMDCGPCPDAVPVCDSNRCTAVYGLPGDG